MDCVTRPSCLQSVNMSDILTICAKSSWRVGLSLGLILGLGLTISPDGVRKCLARPPGLETLPGQDPSQSNEENARAAGHDLSPDVNPAAPAAPEAQPAESQEAPLTLDGSNPIFAFTHLLPSPLTLPAGQLMLGSEVAYGLFGWAQVGTGLVEDIYQVFNVDAKVKLIDYPKFTLGASAAFETYNYQNYGPANPDMRVNAWLPGLTAGYEVAPRFAVFVGGNLNVTNQQIPSSVQTSGYVHGAQVETDFSYAYNPPPRTGYIGNVVAGGLSYDMTYRVTGIGISHYWRGFKLGFHYYVNANQNRFLPIIAGGTVVDF